MDVVPSRRTCPARIGSLLRFCISAHNTYLHCISCTSKKAQDNFSFFFSSFLFHAVRLHILTYAQYAYVMLCYAMQALSHNVHRLFGCRSLASRSSSSSSRQAAGTTNLGTATLRVLAFGRLLAQTSAFCISRGRATS